jgi:glutamate-ammonia-ligase adenylyltransferase
VNGTGPLSSTGPLNSTPDDDRGSSRAARLVRLGFVDPRHAGTVATASRLGFGILTELAKSPDPDLALESLAHLLAAADDVPTLRRALDTDVALRARLFAVLGASAALGDHLASHPADWHQLADPELDAVRPTVTGLQAELLEAVEETYGSAVSVALGARYRRLLLQLAARDLVGGLSLDEVAAELADLAGATLDAALEIAVRELPLDAVPCRLAIIGMGKCGGRELNYVSDVDVIFVAEPATVGGTALDEAAALRTATQLATAVMRICAPIWQVDANLRPEGKMGPLVRTLASHVAYYQRWAKTWEFQALLKARPVSRHCSRWCGRPRAATTSSRTSSRCDAASNRA